MVELIDPRGRSIGASTVRRVLPAAQRRMVGPFIFLDIIGPEVISPGRSVDVDAHPHIGLSTLTYLLEGRLVHRDSIGAVQVIAPGEVNWMTAGTGVCHTERSHPDDVSASTRLHGVQIWIALPDGAEDVEPSFGHFARPDLPKLRLGGADVVLVAGSAWEEESPVPTASPLVLADLEIDGAAPMLVEPVHPELAVLVIEGEIAVDNRALTSGQLAVAALESSVRIDGEGRALLIGGESVGPRNIWWNFVHSDPAAIERAKSDWAAQRFPLVPGDHDPWVPLPGMLE